MARFSNGIITIINLLTLVLSFCAIALSVWFYIKVGSTCERMIRMPLLVVGGTLLVVSMMGLLGACCRVSFFMWLYLITLFLLIVGLIALTAFAIAVTNKGIGQALSENGIKNGRLGDYSWWLQEYVINPHNWDRIKTCLIDVRLCESIVGGMHEDFYRQSLFPIQSGCCKQPNNCGMSEKGPVPGPDCKIWSSEKKQLCYNCESCKKAVLDNITNEWRMLAIINTLILISITIIYSIGCCALRNNQNYGYTKYKSYYA
ncbi:tetraspanin-8 [Phtheirospermum japonicum]|uniref:Tetraspanin-8 n=1 Tax=Phtheirospermum japonicum TaxID=374723 RepID=A0A830BEB9_9LAMI|nr:tetraspanin-8 [Phtheirospermum japonicum]